MAPIDKKGYTQIKHFASLAKRHSTPAPTPSYPSFPSLIRSGPMASVTLLRANDILFACSHFRAFVREMHGEKKKRGWIKWGLLAVAGVGLGIGYYQLRK